MDPAMLRHALASGLLSFPVAHFDSELRFSADSYEAHTFGSGVTYSSAVFNFVPELARRFFEALRAGDKITTDAILEYFFLPFARFRDRAAGYAVSAIKAGAALIGHDPGPVRPPLTDFSHDERRTLVALIECAPGFFRAAA